MKNFRDWAYISLIVLLFVLLANTKERIKCNIEDAQPLKEIEVYVVNATVYHAVKGQCDSTPLITASGARIKSADKAYDHRYIAVSRDLLDVFPYGTKVEVSGCDELSGEYTVVDTMNRRYKGYIDILINPNMKQGKWSGVRIKKI